MFNRKLKQRVKDLEKDNKDYSKRITEIEFITNNPNKYNKGDKIKAMSCEYIVISYSVWENMERDVMFYPYHDGWIDYAYKVVNIDTGEPNNIKQRQIEDSKDDNL